MNNEDRRKLEDAIQMFPATFKLRAFPGELFRISRDSSYISEGKVMLYTQIQKGNDWLDFDKGTVSELRAEVIF
jgi:hypothetical protein